MRKPSYPLDPVKRDYFYPEKNFQEEGSEGCASLKKEDIDNADVREMFDVLSSASVKEIYQWLLDNRANFSANTLVLGLIHNGKDDIPMPQQAELYQAIIVKRMLHTIYELDKFLVKVNERMAEGGYLVCMCRTSSLKKQVMYTRFKWKWLSRPFYLCHYIWHRVCPKMGLTKRFYFWATKGSNRTFHRVEILGRLYHAGFEVTYETTAHNEYRVIARKVKAPITGDTPSTSPIAKLHRVGKGGKLITVYKFRTMYSYSEYIQEYVYQHRKLDKSGKFYQDYRVNTIGHILRRTWLDELPMLINILKGEMKLVGVRPLSEQYFNLYTPEMQQLRTQTKPGLLPPLYYEKEQPETLEGIQESERRYCEAYLKHPLRTDWKYFWGIVGNILFNKKHSH